MPITTDVEAPKERYQSRSGKWRERESTARFEVKGARHAEGQQTGHDLCGGIGKTSDRTHNVRKKMDRPRNSTEVVLTGLARERTFSSTVQGDVFCFAFCHLNGPKLIVGCACSLVCSILCTIRYT